MTTKSMSFTMKLWSGRLTTALLACLCLGVALPVNAVQVCPIGIGPVTIMAEIAATPSQTSRGLMFRRLLPADRGMLFVFPYPRRLSFWMRNTTIALDIGYFDARGELREIYRLQPLDERPVRSRSDALLYALEVNHGWYQRNGVSIGSRLNPQELAQALSGECQLP